MPDIDATTVDPDLLAAAIAATAERRATETAAHDAARDAIVAELRTMTERAASLTAGAAAAGIVVPDLAGIVAAAVSRVAPAAPEHVAAVIAPAPVATTPAVRPAGTERTRQNPARVVPTEYDGAIWSVRLAGATGRVRTDVAADGTTSYVATTGNRGTWDSPTRAAQSACGDPETDAPSVAGRGRRAATVNGWRAMILVRTAGASRDDVANGPRLMTVAPERAPE